MGERGFRYSIVTSNGTLLVTFLYMTAMRLLSLNSNISEPSIWGGYLATVVVGYFLLELNNRNALLRVRSRMVSSTFLVLVGTFPVLLDFSTGFVSAGAMLLSLYILFFTDQRRHAQGYVFYSFLFLGIGVVAYPRMLWFAPLFLLTMIVQLRSMTLKAFFAGLLGLALPIAVTWAYLFVTLQPVPTGQFAATITTVSIPDYRLLTEHQLINAAFTLLLALVATIHFWRTKFNDKIRTRILFYIFMIVEGLSAAMLIALPTDYDMAYRLFIVSSSPLIAHHLSFSRGHVADAYFVVVVLCFAFLAFYNLTGYEFGIWPR